MRSKKNKVPDYIRKQRGDWGDISPVTKVIPNKKKNPRIKHKGKEFDQNENQVKE